MLAPPFPFPAQAACESGPPGSFQLAAGHHRLTRSHQPGGLVCSGRCIRPAVRCCAQRLHRNNLGGSLLKLVDEHAESLDPADREGLDIGPPHHQRLRVLCSSYLCLGAEICEPSERGCLLTGCVRQPLGLREASRPPCETDGRSLFAFRYHAHCDVNPNERTGGRPALPCTAVLRSSGRMLAPVWSVPVSLLFLRRPWVDPCYVGIHTAAGVLRDVFLIWPTVMHTTTRPSSLPNRLQRVLVDLRENGNIIHLVGGSSPLDAADTPQTLPDTSSHSRPTTRLTSRVSACTPTYYVAHAILVRPATAKRC